MQGVAADLRAPLRGLLLAALGGELVGAAALLLGEQARPRRICIAVALFCAWERSFWLWATIPVGVWVTRTAESVLLTCWPPAPEAR